MVETANGYEFPLRAKILAKAFLDIEEGRLLCIDLARECFDPTISESKFRKLKKEGKISSYKIGRMALYYKHEIIEVASNYKASFNLKNK